MYRIGVITPFQIHFSVGNDLKMFRLAIYEFRLTIYNNVSNQAFYLNGIVYVKQLSKGIFTLLRLQVLKQNFLIYILEVNGHKHPNYLLYF